MNEISQERLERFWEWCGMRRRRTYKSLEPHDRGTDKWVLGKYYGVDPPDLDLNNLFKWAVPKAVQEGIHSFEFLYDEGRVRCFMSPLSNWTVHKDPATALFLAIEKLIV